jgi:mannose-6-phosphate isomerase-like protein (cupin superfamily)
MHTTDTIDYVFIVSGAADLELDDGRKERVTGGDCVIQRGTRHAWRVVGDEPLVLCAILIGAERIG